MNDDVEEFASLVGDGIDGRNSNTFSSREAVKCVFSNSKHDNNVAASVG